MRRHIRKLLSLRVSCLFALLPLFAASAAARAQAIFADGFEEPDLCSWSAKSAIYQESFSLPDASPWPSPWVIAGGIVESTTLGGRGRLRSVTSSFEPGRLVAPVATRDVEVQFSFVMEDVAHQGVGFYVRQNGGWLTHSTPLGQGYAVFVEGFVGSQIGIWRELGGIETPLPPGRLATPFSYTDGVDYRVRFRVNQMSPTQTLLQAKVWAEAGSEPAAWNVVAIDDTPELQNLTDGIAVDLFNFTGGSGFASIDNVVITELCNPLAERGPIETLGDSFIFAEGPVWRGDHLLFTDLGTVGAPATATIYRFTPPSSVTVERPSSNYANGLANAVAGDAGSALLACEHATRRVSTTDAGGAITTLVDNYLGDAFNSPNDLATRADGTLYFTDPSYGLPHHGGAREIFFNGLYRRTPAGVLTAEWQGHQSNNQPNGVALSPDQRTLYVADTQQGQLLAWDLAADGSTSGQRVVASGLTIPDGLCVDRRGNIYVATWDQEVAVYSPDGNLFGFIPLARDATNCAFGGADSHTLFVTAHDQLYAIELTRPGIP